jgi:hypothetical protein
MHQEYNNETTQQTENNGVLSSGKGGGAVSYLLRKMGKG